QLQDIAVDCNFSTPETDSIIDAAVRINGVQTKMTAVAKHQTHSFENKCAIVAPLIGISRPNQLGDAGPVFLFDFVKKTLSVPVDLALRLPQPEAIQTDRKSRAQSHKQSGPKINAHEST